MVYKYPICDVFHWFCKIAKFFATEPINLQYHATFNDFQNFLLIAKNGYNLREHSSFNYRSPVEIWNSSGVLLSVTAGGLWT